MAHEGSVLLPGNRIGKGKWLVQTLKLLSVNGLWKLII